MFASARPCSPRWRCSRSSSRSARRRARSSGRARRSPRRDRAGPRPAATSTTGTSPRRRCGSTPTPISSAPAGSPRSSSPAADGHVLIDGGTEQGAELIAANIRALGFKLARHPLSCSTATSIIDHVGGHRAAAAADRRDAGRLGAGRDGARHAAPPARDDPQAGMHPAASPPARVGRVIGDGDDGPPRQSAC